MPLSLVMTIAAAALSPQGGEQPSVVVITPDNVELNGAGRFRFEAAAAAFRDRMPIAPFVDRIWFDPDGRTVGCDVVKAPSQDVAKIGCAQLLQHARFERVAGYDLPFRRGFVDVRFSQGSPLRPDPAAPLVALATPGYSGVAITYPAPPVPEAALLQPGDGQVTAEIRPDDYPPSALRAGLSARSGVLLGFAPDGTAKSCRPVGSGRVALLDNHTCVVMLQRARFTFANGAPRGQGLRYGKTGTVWVIP